MSDEADKAQIIDLSSLPPDTYVSIAQVGNCRVCGAKKDLRAGVCSKCSPLVDGRKIEGGHELWEKANPQNRWMLLVG